MPSPFLLLQLADSAFPTGGFAHSGGLEAAYQLGEIDGPEGLAKLLVESLDQAGHGALPLVSAAHGAPERLPELDHLCDAFTTNHITNRASRAQGQAWLATAAATFGDPAIGALRVQVRAEGLFGHLAPVFGAITRILGVVLDDAQKLFLFLHLRSLVSSAVRLNAIGPIGAQSLQHRLGEQALRVWGRCRALGPEDLAQTSPLLDLFQGHHDRLYSRLFSS
ncbi:MAG: urease accessory UreF family protein [Minicystis sp.]